MSDLDTIKIILEEREKTHQVRYESIETGLKDINTFITSQNKTIVSQGKEIVRLGSVQKITTWVMGSFITASIASVFSFLKGP